MAARSADVYEEPKAVDAAREYAVTLARGLPNEKHTLEVIVEGKGEPPLRAIRVYRPPVK